MKDPHAQNRKRLQAGIAKIEELNARIERQLRLSENEIEKERLKGQLAEQRRFLKKYRRELAKLETSQPAASPLHAGEAEELPSPPVPPPGEPSVVPEPSHQPPESGQNYALLVGIDAYPRLRRLGKAVTDARDMGDLLKERGYPADNLLLLLDGQASKGALNHALDGLARRAGPQDRVLIFFSGHGAQRIGGFAPGEYLCPVEADWLDLKASAISSDELTTALRAIHAGQLVVLLDACHSGGVGQPREAEADARPGFSEASYAAFAAGGGRAVIAACQANEVSWELPGMRNGLFTHYVLEGLRRGQTTVFALFEYLAQHVPQQVDQHPLFKGELSRSWPLVGAPD